MVGVLGIEPRNGGTKNPCLTAWLHPNKDLEFGENTKKNSLCKHSESAKVLS